MLLLVLLVALLSFPQDLGVWIEQGTCRASVLVIAIAVIVLLVLF